MNAETAYKSLCQNARETATLAAIEELLGWDERCLAPPEAGEQRAEQMTLLSGMVHARRVDPKIGEWLTELADSDLAKDPATDAGATIRNIRRKYDKLCKLPQSLVEELTRTAVLGQQAWDKARKANDFASFAPWLVKTFELKRQQADAIGYETCRYDALLDDFEPYEKTARVATVLEGLRKELVPFVAEVIDSGRKPDLSILSRHYPQADQETFGKRMASECGFDFRRGRLDVTSHPFCMTAGAHDCRITTRYDENFFNMGLFGILHEAGHGIYEQGLRPELFGLPPGEAISLGIHESQSRMWENLVGRSSAFWEYAFPHAQTQFPAALSDVKRESFYAAINHVEPSLIRVEADEATYNLHILIRFELEQALINDELSVADLPEAWHGKYREYLGVHSPTDADGVLQDIHWSAGLIGYFATYSLGNLYASQFFAQADKDLGGLSAQFRKGEFAPLREWLREKIHRHGQCYTADQLIQRVTGAPLSPAPLMQHLRSKFGPLYGV